MSGPFGDGKAHVAEYLGDLVEHLADGMDAAVLQRAEPDGQRDVGLLGGEPGGQRAALEIALAGIERLADARLEAVDGLAEDLALVGGQRAQLRHQLGDAALAAECGNAHALDRSEVAGSGDLAEKRGLEGGEVLCHGCHPGRSASARESRDPVADFAQSRIRPWVPDRRCATSGMTDHAAFSLAAA